MKYSFDMINEIRGRGSMYYKFGFREQCTIIRMSWESMLIPEKDD